MSDMQTMRVEIAKLQLSPGDVLVVKVNAPISDDVARRIKADLEPRLPPGVKSIVLGPEFSLAVLTQTDVAKLKAA